MECRDCKYFYAWNYPGRLTNYWGQCGVNLPPWAQNKENEDRKVAQWDGCDLGQPREE